MMNMSESTHAEDAMSLSDAIAIAKTVMASTSLSDAVAVFERGRSPKPRRAVAYSRSSIDADVMDNIAAQTAEEHNAVVKSYVFDRPGSFEGLTEILGQPYAYDIVLIDARDREALEANGLLNRLVEKRRRKVVWMPESEKSLPRGTNEARDGRR